MGANSITLTTVAVGADADRTLLQSLATLGKGRYYDTGNGDALPQIFAHESHLASRSYIIEHPFSPERTAPSSILDGLGGLPALQGYVGTTPKPTGQVSLVSDAGDPLLAQWQYGLGRVVAWTSDAKGQWARDWVGWSDFPRFWTQALRWSTGAEAGNVLQPRVDLEGSTAHITVDAASPDGSYLSGLTVGAQVVAPSAQTTTVTLKQSAVGTYEGTFPATEEGAYLLRVQASGTGLSGGSAGQTFGMVVPYSPEFRGTPSDTGLMARLASLTGGRVLSLNNPQAALDHDLPSARTTTDVWPLLLLLAILLLPFDIGVRRLAFTRDDVRRALAAVRARVRLTARPAPAMTAAGASTTQLSALLGAKERGRGRLVKEGDGEAARPVTAGAARDLQVEGRTGRTSGREVRQGGGQAVSYPTGPGPQFQPLPTAQRPAPHLPAPISTAGEGAESTESMAARLRKAREQRR
jgi:Putative glutamine amidotransferase